MAFHYSPKEFIKVYRKLLDWEWYTDINTKTLFIHCLLRANWKAGSWKGIEYEAGEFITSLPRISAETGLSIQQARTALEHLELTGEITSRITDKVTGKKYRDKRVITVNNWDNYQGDNRQSNSQINSQSNSKSTDNQQTTTQSSNNRYKNIKNIKEEKNKEKEINKEKESADLDADDWWNSLEDETPEEWRQT